MKNPTSSAEFAMVRMTPDGIYDQLTARVLREETNISWGGNPGVGSPAPASRPTWNPIWPLP